MVSHYSFVDILQQELPSVYTAFLQFGCSPSQVMQRWVDQCFLNYLDWHDILHYISLCTLLGEDFQLYVCVAIFNHMEEMIRLHSKQQDLYSFLITQPIMNFRVATAVRYMLQLKNKYNHQ